MTAIYVGSLSIGAAVPGAGVAASAGNDGLNAAFPDIEARIAALVASLSALAAMPALPSFPDMVARATANLAGLQVAIAMPGLPPPPSIATAIATLTAALTDLKAMLTGIDAKLDVIAQFQQLLAAAGVHVVAFDGAIGSLGTQVQAAINTPIPGGTAHALVLATTDAATWSAMTQVFKVTP